MGKQKDESHKAIALVEKYGLRDHKLLRPTLEDLLYKLCAYWGLNKISLSLRNLGWMTLGRFWTRGTGWSYGTRTYEPDFIALNKHSGLTFNTLLHEFAHYKDFCERGVVSHGPLWKKCHELVLMDFVDNWGANGLTATGHWIEVNSLNWFWTHRKHSYLAYWYKGISSDVLLGLLTRLERKLMT